MVSSGARGNAGPDPGTARCPSTSSWAPLRIAGFRWLWIGALVSNIGTFVQTVGAQWMLVQEAKAATLVSLVSTAQALPVLLLAMPAGVLADSLDRRRLLIFVLGLQTAVALLMTGLTVTDRMSPALLLVLTFGLASGAAVQVPAYQALVPDLVPRSQIPEASALGSISFNLARAVGPALAGVLVAHAGVHAVFAVNALCCMVFGMVLLTWRRAADPPGTEPFVPALVAGGRYVRHSRVVRRILLRSAMFMVPANVVWSLLAVVARQRLELDAGGYGVVLGAVGVGSIIGAFALPTIRSRLSANRIITAAAVVYAAALLGVAATHATWLAMLALLAAGVAWMCVLATLNASLHTFLPVWVRARGIAIFQIVTFGSMAGAGVSWGAVADHVGLTSAYASAAALLLVGAALGGVLPLLDAGGLDRAPARFWPDPRVEIDVDDHPGAVLVVNTYTVTDHAREQLQVLAPALRRMRLRTGGTSWSLYVDAADPSRHIEQYTVSSWSEHLQQHSCRLTGSDRDIDLRARSLSDPPTEVAHLFTARLPRGHGRRSAP